MNDLDLLEAELVGFDPMDLARALPGVLKGTGQALEKPKPQQPAPAPPPPQKPAPSLWSQIGLPWKIGGGVAVGLLALRLLKR